MRWATITFLLLSITWTVNADWSWGGDENAKPAKSDEHSTLLEGEKLPKADEKHFESNTTVLDDIVDELVSSKQGRSLGGFDDVYSDPTIKDALDAGDDAEARNLIKGRLCTLGLIQCEEEETQEKRYLSPDDVIYAQPVDIKPIGKPIASIPVRGPPRAYGPPQPMPYPGRPQKLPPKRIGYGGNIRPGFSDKYGVAGSTYQYSQNGALYNSHETNYVTKPPTYASQSPYAYENSKPYNKLPSSQSGTKTDSIVQQHVHHHYVHSEAEKDPKVIIKPVAIPVGSIGQLSQTNLQQATDVITASGGDYSSFSSGGFKPMSGSYGLDNNKPIYESENIYGSQYGHNTNKFGGNVGLTQGLPNQYSGNVFEEHKFGNGLGSYAQNSNTFYKKELHVGSDNNLFNQGAATFGQSNAYADNYHEAKAQGFDCVCVNYDQCPSQEVIGRRDDLYLPIDPRNKGSDISALTEEQLDNLNKTENSQNITSIETKKISKRDTKEEDKTVEAKEIEPRQAYYGRPPVQQCRPNQVCCRRPLQPQAANKGQCGIRHSQGINGRIKTPAYVDGESEFGEYPWQTAILKKDPKESVYVCGGTLIDGLHIMTAAHCIKSYKGFELRVRLGEWDVNRDVEFYPYIERDIVSVHVHPLYYAGTLDNDLAILKMDHPVEWTKYPHISPACLPDKYTDYAGQRCWTTGWGKDAFGDYGKYQNVLKEVDVPILSHGQCQQQLKQTRLGYNYELNPGFLCAGGEEGKDACKGDGGGPLVCERGGTWQLVGVVSWGIGCGQPGVPGVYVKVAQYLDWIAQVTGKFSPY